MIFTNQIKTGKLIREMRLKLKMTQLELAEKLHISDKAISKWERGIGAPELSVMPLLADALKIDVDTLFKGELKGNDMSNGNLKKLKFYVCPDCGNLIFSTDLSDIHCCGKKLAEVNPQKANETERLTVETVENELFITSTHEMIKTHYISFVALLTGDTLIIKKQYPEWGLETRLPFFEHGTLLWYCTRHGLFFQ